MKDFQVVIAGKRISTQHLEQKIKQDSESMKNKFSKIHNVIQKFGVDEEN